MNLLSTDVLRPQLEQSSPFEFQKPEIDFGYQEIFFYSGQFSLDQNSELFELKFNKENLPRAITDEDYKRMKEEHRQATLQVK